MFSYGLNVIILGFCESGSTVAIHSGDMGSNPTWSNFFVQYFNTRCIAKVTNTELRDINQLMGYRGT